MTKDSLENLERMEKSVHLVHKDPEVILAKMDLLVQQVHLAHKAWMVKEVPQAFLGQEVSKDYQEPQAMQELKVKMANRGSLVSQAKWDKLEPEEKEDSLVKGGLWDHLA